MSPLFGALEVKDGSLSGGDAVGVLADQDCSSA